MEESYNLLVEELTKIKLTLQSIYSISGIRWKRYLLIKDNFEYSNEIWVFSKQTLNNKGTLNIYLANNKKSLKWEVNKKTQILDTDEAGYNMFFISGFDQNFLLLTDIVSGHKLFFMKEGAPLYENKINLNKILKLNKTEKIIVDEDLVISRGAGLKPLRFTKSQLSFIRIILLILILIMILGYIYNI